MLQPTQFIIEGLDRLGKDTLVDGIQHRLGYHQVFHYTKPLSLECYVAESQPLALRRYQEVSFRIMFQLLTGAPMANVICNRAHLGECVYAPLYRKYDGGYVFDLEREFGAQDLPRTRLVLLTENFDISVHFRDDNKSLGGPDRRREEQALFLRAFDASTIRDKRAVCVTDPQTGGFRSPASILEEVLA